MRPNFGEGSNIYFGNPILMIFSLCQFLLSNAIMIYSNLLSTEKEIQIRNLSRRKKLF